MNEGIFVMVDLEEQEAFKSETFPVLKKAYEPRD